MLLKVDILGMNQKNKKLILFIIIVLICVGICLIFVSKTNIESQGNKQEPNDKDEIEIIVRDNPDGFQLPNQNSQQNNVIMDNLGAATIEDITGQKESQIFNQPQGIEEILKDKEIEIGK